MRDPIFRASLLASIVAAAVLSGCIGDSGKGGGSKKGESAPVDTGLPAGDAQVSDTTGAIDGLVADAAFNPLPGAKATILDPPGGNSSTTDADGRFVFNDLAPGSYKLVAERLGYDSKAVSVAVTAGEVSKVTFNLPELAVEGVAHQEPYEFTGFISCGVGVGGVVAGDLCAEDENAGFLHEFNMSNGVATVVVTAKWTSAALIGQGLMVLVEKEGCDIDCRDDETYGLADGNSPLTVRIEGEKLATVQPAVENATVTVQIRVFPSADEVPELNVFFQQSFKLYVNVFYVDPAPEGFTGLPDE